MTEDVKGVPEGKEETREETRMEDCFCKTAFYHVRFPSIGTQVATLYAGPTAISHDLNDRVYTKSNSTDFGITPSGKLYLKKPGTYMLHYDLRVEGVDGSWPDSAFEAMAQVETPTGYTPYQSQLVRLLHEPVGEDTIVHRAARYHASVMIHVGDATYGVDSYGATITFWTQSSGGPFTYASEMHATLIKL